MKIERRRLPADYFDFYIDNSMIAGVLALIGAFFLIPTTIYVFPSSLTEITGKIGKIEVIETPIPSKFRGSEKIESSIKIKFQDNPKTYSKKRIYSCND